MFICLIFFWPDPLPLKIETFQSPFLYVGGGEMGRGETVIREGMKRQNLLNRRQHTSHIIDNTKTENYAYFKFQ